MRKAIFALCLFFSAGAGAEPLETRGFASLTLTDVSKYEVGVGASFRGDHLDVHGLTVVGRDGDFHSAGLRYLYAERQEALGDSGTSAVGVRVGRVRHWLGFHNLKRENPHDADYIWHPPAIYREQAVRLASSGDGAQAYVKTSLGEWDATLNVTHVRPVLAPMDESVAVIFGDPAVGRFDRGSRFTGVNVALASPARTLELRYDMTRLNLEFQPSAALAGLLSPGNTDTRMHTLGARVYVTDDLDVTLERIAVRNEGRAVWDRFHAAWPVRGDPGGASVTVRWRPTPSLQVAATVDRWCTDETDCDGKRGAALSIPAHRFYSKTKTVAIRYRVDRYWTVTAQAMHIDGSNTELTTRSSGASTGRFGLRATYAW